MLKVRIIADEDWDEVNEVFLPALPPVDLYLEHSLVSVSKWESKYHKSFISTPEKTREEYNYYIKCMTVKPEEVPDEVYHRIPDSVISEVAKYIDDPMTATWFSEDGPTAKAAKKRNPFGKETATTAETIYYQMITWNIPMECQHWHLNRLLTLIRVMGEMNSPKKKVSQREMTRRYAELNAKRRAKLGTSG